MAGDWIKVENTTPDKPEIFQIATALSIEPDEVLGKLIRFWIWCDEHFIDGNALSVTKKQLDHILRREGFSDAMLDAGWLKGRDGKLSVPNHNRCNGKTAKQRALTAKRVASHKTKTANDDSVSDALPREEKRRDKSPYSPPTEISHLPEQLQRADFLECWLRWCQHRSETGHPLKKTHAGELLAEFDEWGCDRAIAAIRYTLRMGWRGIREPEGRDKSSAPLEKFDAKKWEQTPWIP